MTFAELTLHLRHKVGLGFLGLVAPKLKADMLESYNRIFYDVPRPFTLMLSNTTDKAKSLVGCEIGFGFGNNAEDLLKRLNIHLLYCVDPYFGSQHYLDSGRDFDCFSGGSKEFVTRKSNLERSGKVEFIQSLSDDCWTRLPKDLDFIYIDGNHTTEVVYRDIVNAMNKIKVGGFVGGHDFFNTGFGVTEAVYKYSRDFNVLPVLSFPDYWFQKVK